MENQLLIALSRNKLLRNIDISKIDLQNVKGKLITLGEGEILYREGDTAEIIFLLVSGQVNVLKKRLLGKTKSYLFIENDFFGHEEYFEETSRTSTAVALVDSYLISLTSDEIDSLIRQNDEILANLKEPVPENFIEELLKKEREHPFQTPADLKDFDDLSNVEDEPVLRPNVVDDGTTMDFFKSISDFSRSKESNLIHPLEPFKEDAELSEVGTPAELPQKTLTQEDFEPVPEQVENENDTHNEAAPFDENMFLNEDGIPKAEFELPHVESKPEIITEAEEINQPEVIDYNEAINEPEKIIDNGLDDALFQILSGGDILNFEPTHENINYKANQPHEENVPIQPVTKDIEETKVEFHSEAEEIVEEIKDEIPVLDMNEIESNSINAEPALINDAEIEKEFLPESIDEEPVKAVNIFPEEYGAVEENEITTEEKKTADIPNYVLNVLEKISSSINLNEVLKNIADAAKILTSSDVSLIFQIEWNKNELWTMVDTGFGNKEIRFKIGEGITGLSAKNGEAVIINGVSKDKRFNFDLEKIFCETAGSILAFPIKNKKNEIVAVLELIKKRPFEFNEEHEEKLNMLSISFANAIKNAEQAEGLIRKEREYSLSKISSFLDQEIKKPILLSKRYTELLKSKQPSQDVNSILDSLAEQLNVVADVVTTTSNYSEKRIPARIMNVSLNNSLRDFSLKAEQYAESRFCQIINELDGDATVKMDVKEFYQCYIIIIKNACEAIPDGGKIIVSTTKLDHNIEIHIKDNGRGISDELKTKIFEPFFSEGKREGTGIGLAIAKRVVEAHNGTIKVNSTVGEGADFIITLPIVSAF